METVRTDAEGLIYATEGTTVLDVYKRQQMDAVMEEIEKLCRKIPESEQMLAIKGIGVITVAGFLAEEMCIRDSYNSK